MGELLRERGRAFERERGREWERESEGEELVRESVGESV